MHQIVVNQKLLASHGITLKEIIVLNAIHFAIKHKLLTKDGSSNGFWYMDGDILKALTPLLPVQVKVLRMVVDSLATKGCLVTADPVVNSAQKVAITQFGASFIVEEKLTKVAGVAMVETTEVIEHLNAKRKEFLGATRPLTLTKTTEGFISNRLKKYTVQDLKDVIDLKMIQWANNPQMKDYLTPKTLFNETNFENYIQQVDVAKQNPKQFIDDQQSNINQQQRPDSYTSLTHIYSGLAEQLGNR